MTPEEKCGLERRSAWIKEVEETWVRDRWRKDLWYQGSLKLRARMGGSVGL